MGMLLVHRRRAVEDTKNEIEQSPVAVVCEQAVAIEDKPKKKRGRPKKSDVNG